MRVLQGNDFFDTFDCESIRKIWLNNYILNTFVYKCLFEYIFYLLPRLSVDTAVLNPGFGNSQTRPFPIFSHNHLTWSKVILSVLRSQDISKIPIIQWRHPLDYIFSYKNRKIFQFNLFKKKITHVKISNSNSEWFFFVYQINKNIVPYQTRFELKNFSVHFRIYSKWRRENLKGRKKIARFLFTPRNILSGPSRKFGKTAEIGLKYDSIPAPFRPGVVNHAPLPSASIHYNKIHV